MKKRILSFVLVVCILAVSVPFVTLTATAAVNPWAGTGTDQVNNPLMRDVDFGITPVLSWYAGLAGDAYAEYDGDPLAMSGILSRETGYAAYLAVFDALFTELGMSPAVSEAGTIPNFDVDETAAYGSAIPTAGTADGYVTRTCLGVARKTAEEADTYQYVYSYTFDPRRVDGYTGPDNIPTVVLNTGTQGEEKCAIYGIYWLVRDIMQNADEDATGWLNYYRNNIRFIIVPCLSPSGMNDNTYWNAGNVNINRNMDVNNWYSVMNAGGYNQDGTPNIHGQYSATGAKEDRTQNSGYEAFDQPEARMIRDLILENKDMFMFIDCHTCTGGSLGSATNYWEKLNWLAIKKTVNPYYNKMYEAAERQLAAMKYNLKQEFDLPYADSDTVGAITNSAGQRSISDWAIEQGIISMTHEGFGGFVGDPTYGYSGNVQRANSELIGNFVMQILYTYANIEETPEETYTTTFSLMNENFPVIGGLAVNALGYYDTASLDTGDYAKSISGNTYRNNWILGYKSLSGDGTTFTDNPANFTQYKAYAYKKVVNAGTAYEKVIPTVVYASNNQFYSATGNGSLWLEKDFQSISGYSASTKTWSADPTIRYVAEYDGTVVINIEDLLFYAVTGQLVVMHNGEELGTVKGTNRSSTWIIKNGVWVGETNIVGESGTFTVQVKKGDNIDFVCHNDVRAADSTQISQVVGEDGKALTQVNGDNCKRGVRDFNISIRYFSGNTGAFTSSNTGTSADVSGTYPTSIRPFFTWYKADGTAITTNSTLDDAAYMTINSRLVELGIVAADDDYATALQKYIQYIKATAKCLTPTGDWLVGAMEGATPTTVGANFAPINSYAFLSDSNIYLGAGHSTKYYNTINQYHPYVTENYIEYQINSYVQDAVDLLSLKKGDGSSAVSGTTVADYKFETTYAALNASLVKAPMSGGDYLPACMVAEPYRLGTDYQGVVFKPHYAGAVKDRTGAVAYRVPAGQSGLAVLQVKDLSYHINNGVDFEWAVYLNDELVVPFTSYKTTDTPDSVNAILQTKQIAVKANDLVCFAVKNSSAGALYIAPALEITIENTTQTTMHQVEVLDTNGNSLHTGLYTDGAALGSIVDSVVKNNASFAANGYAVAGNYYAAATDTATLPDVCGGRMTVQAFDPAASTNLSIAAAYSINAVLPGNGAIAAGVEIAGEAVPAQKGADGTFRVSMLSVVAKDLLSATVTVTPYHTYGNTQVRGAERTVKGADLLATYEASPDTKVANLATATRQYAEAANAYFTDAVLSDETKAELLTADSVLSALDKTITYDPVETDGYAFAAATVALDDTLNFVFRVIPVTGEAANLKNCKVKVEGALGGTFGGFGTTTINGETAYVIVLPGLPATGITEPLTFTVVDENEKAVSTPLTYSVSTYCARTFVAGEDSEVNNIIRAIYLLGQAADAYEA